MGTIVSSCREVVSIVVILGGCFVYAWYDAQFDSAGYMWVGHVCVPVHY
jgi:hypothetical protein